MINGACKASLLMERLPASEMDTRARCLPHALLAKRPRSASVKKAELVSHVPSSSYRTLGVTTQKHLAGPTHMRATWGKNAMRLLCLLHHHQVPCKEQPVAGKEPKERVLHRPLDLCLPAVYQPAASPPSYMCRVPSCLLDAK